jgi:S-layer homology domain.
MKKILLAAVIAIVLTLSSVASFAGTGDVSVASGDKFTDISKHWAKDAINRVVDKSIFSDKDGKFYPNKAITRSEFALMLHKALGIKIEYFKATDINEFYSDVKNTDSYASDLYDLVIANIIDTKDKFRPTEALNRADMVHYIINSLEYKTGGNYSMIMIYPEPFKDDSDIKAEYKNDFVKAQVLKLVLGRGDKKFYAKSAATRAEAATVINRLLNLLESYEQNEQVHVNPSFKIGTDSMELKLEITNNTKQTVTINHSSGQKYDFTLLDSEKKDIYRWSADKSFIQMLTATEIEPGKTVEFKENIQGDLFNTLKDKAVYMRAYIIGESNNFAVNADGYETTKN